MNHTPVAGTPCATCHETGRSWYGVTIVTRPTPAQDPNHPLTGECGSCHSSTVSFSSGITSKPPNHIPTSQPCALCHTTPGNYAVATMNHLGITSGCATCHAAGLTFANIVPVAPPPTHVPTTQACELCHSASKFTNFSGGTMNHAGISTGCATCHATGKSFFGITVVTPPATHIPTTAACEAVPRRHASSPTSAGGTMNHAGISTGCATCHATGKSFYGVTVVTPPATHIPSGGAACESCHAPAKFTNFGGTAMNHTPVAGTPCATCHESGKSWYGVTIVTLPSTGHIPNPSSLDCGGCHTSTTSFKTWTMNHTGITTNCSSCHGGQFPGVRSKPRDHPPTTADCSQCHNTSSFDGGSRVTAAKSTESATALAPRRDAAPTPPQARANAGIPATPGNAEPRARGAIHAAVMPGGCASCHNGSSAPGRPARHLATLASCDSCHRTTAWIPANFTHTGVATGTCATCHNGSGATAKPASHFVTSRSCDSCHRTTAWRPVQPYQHLSPGYPANHPTGVTCKDCHAGNSELVVWRYPNLKPACGACHGADFKGGARMRPAPMPSPRPGPPGAGVGSVQRPQ